MISSSRRAIYRVGPVPLARFQLLSSFAVLVLAALHVPTTTDAPTENPQHHLCIDGLMFPRHSFALSYPS